MATINSSVDGGALDLSVAARAVFQREHVDHAGSSTISQHCRFRRYASLRANALPREPA